VAVFEGELGDAGFVELAEAFNPHCTTSSSKSPSPKSCENYNNASEVNHPRHPFSRRLTDQYGVKIAVRFSGAFLIPDFAAPIAVPNA
jgi:hypothetical protein